MPLTPEFVAFSLILGVAVFTDLRDRRIPNGVTVTGLLVALLFEAMVEASVPWTGLAGAGLALLLGFPLFALGGIGAGDAKLLAAVGAFVGPLGLLAVVIYGGLAGGVIVFFDAWRRGAIVPLLLNTKDVFVNLVTFGRVGDRRTISTPGARTLPYGVAIAVGGFAAWFLPLPGATS